MRYTWLWLYQKDNNFFVSLMYDLLDLITEITKKEKNIFSCSQLKNIANNLTIIKIIKLF